MSRRLHATALVTLALTGADTRVVALPDCENRGADRCELTTPAGGIVVTAALG